VASSPRAFILTDHLRKIQGPPAHSWKPEDHLFMSSLSKEGKREVRPERVTLPRLMLAATIIQSEAE